MVCVGGIGGIGGEVDCGTAPEVLLANVELSGKTAEGGVMGRAAVSGGNWPPSGDVSAPEGQGAGLIASDAAFGPLLRAPASGLDVDFCDQGAASLCGGFAENLSAVMARAPVVVDGDAISYLQPALEVEPMIAGLNADVECASAPREPAASTSYNASLASRPVVATNWPPVYPAVAQPPAELATRDVAFDVVSDDRQVEPEVEAYCASAALAARPAAVSNWPGEALDERVDCLFCARDICFGFCAAETDKWRTAAPYCSSTMDAATRCGHQDRRWLAKQMIGVLATALLSADAAAASSEPVAEPVEREREESVRRVESLTELAAAC